MAVLTHPHVPTRRCPNGHVYIIGECGGAMQHGRCPECGAAIGGSGHELEATNARAEEVLSRMQAHLSGGQGASSASGVLGRLGRGVAGGRGAQQQGGGCRLM